MPFARPDLTALRAQGAADIAAALPGSDPLLPVSNLSILADVLSEGAHGAYAYLDFIARQAVPFTAVDEAFEGWAAMKNVVRKAATKATKPATFPAGAGSVVPDGTPVSRSDGVEYVTVGEAVAGGGGSVTVQLRAVLAGAAGTLADGAPVVLGQAIAGVTSGGVAAAGGAPGADVEEFEAFRTRVLQVYANPPQGGAKSDYEEWAGQVAGVTRAWCRPLAFGPGSVVVYFMMDVVREAFGGFPQGTGGVATDETRDTPAVGDHLVVANHIYPLRPVTAMVYAFSPGSNVVDLTINLAGASGALQAAVEDAIRAVFLSYGAPGGRVDNSTIEAAIRAIAGTSGFVITDTACSHGAVSPGDVGNITSDPGFLPVLGDVTWITA